MRLRRNLAALSVITFLSAVLAQASPQNGGFAPVPQNPTAPAPLGVSTIPEGFVCERDFVYQGVSMNCDSYVRQDGEALRPIIKSVPGAVSELNLYQHNRRVIRNAAYVGTLALVVILAGFVANKANGDLQGLKLAGTMTGTGLLMGSLLYGLSAIRSNENHLTHAVETYNQARPDDPIQLQITTGIHF